MTKSECKRYKTWRESVIFCERKVQSSIKRVISHFMLLLISYKLEYIFQLDFKRNCQIERERERKMAKLKYKRYQIYS